MRIIDYLRALQHVFSRNRSRTLLTLLGIMIGSGSIVLLAGLLRGGEEALAETAQRANEADMIQVRRDEPPAKQLGRTRRELARPDATALAESPLLDGAGVVAERSRESQALWRGRKKRARLVAAETGTLELNRLHLARGRFITADDIAERRRVCVLGWDTWRELLEEREDLDGVSVNIAGAQWTVVGVLKNKPPLGGGGAMGTWMWNRKVLVPHTTFDALYDPTHSVERIYVRLRASQELSRHLAAIESVVKATLLRRHLGVQNFKVEGEEGAANEMRLILDIIKLLLLGTGMLSLLVGGINIMNIMLVTVTERTREIGIRRAMGATPRAILTQFLLEAGTIALFGGIVGVLGGALLVWLSSLALTRALGSWNLHIESWAVGLGLALAMSTGVVFGLLPARTAARLDPVEALRYE